MTKEQKPLREHILKRKSQIDNLEEVTRESKVAISRLQSNKSLYSKIAKRKNPEALIKSLYTAIAQIETLVFAELKILESEAFNTLIDTKERNKRIRELRKDISAYERISKSKYDPDKEAKEIELAINNNPISLSRAEETVLLSAIDSYPELFNTISTLSFKRENARPSKKNRDQLVIYIYNLLINHANNDIQKEPGRNIIMTSDIIKAVTPALNLNSDFEITAIKNPINKNIANT